MRSATPQRGLCWRCRSLGLKRAAAARLGHRRNKPTSWVGLCDIPLAGSKGSISAPRLSKDYLAGGAGIFSAGTALSCSTTTGCDVTGVRWPALAQLRTLAPWPQAPQPSRQLSQVSWQQPTVKATAASISKRRMARILSCVRPSGASMPTRHRPKGGSSVHLRWASACHEPFGSRPQARRRYFESARRIRQLKRNPGGTVNGHDSRFRVTRNRGHGRRSSRSCFSTTLINSRAGAKSGRFNKATSRSRRASANRPCSAFHLAR